MLRTFRIPPPKKAEFLPGGIHPAGWETLVYHNHSILVYHNHSITVSALGSGQLKLSSPN